MELRQKADPEMLRYWVWLALVFGSSSSMLLPFLRFVDTPRDIYEIMQAGKYPDLPASAQRGMVKHSLGEADSIVYYCRSHDMTLLPIDSKEYPQPLRLIGKPPILLNAKGNLELLRHPVSIAVVGTRHPSPYTERVTKKIVGDLAEKEFVIISGFAIGVDGIAHTAALDKGGKTIAVLGCGINVNYPREHQALRERMLSSGNGLFLSEYLPGTQPFPPNFPRRNRILSGISEATAVMEAADHSGSLNTAQCASEQGRTLYCVPPADVFDERYAGVIPLLRDGAYPLMSAEDVLLTYYERHPQHMRQSDSGLRNSERLVYAKPAPQKAAAKPNAHRSTGKKPQPEPVLTAPPALRMMEKPLPDSEPGRAIVQYLREHGDTYADNIAAALDLDLSILLSEMTLLELDGFVETLFGKHFRAI